VFPTGLDVLAKLTVFVAKQHVQSSRIALACS
jgi:hypothetical protein